jgi:hypothetical protein
MTISRGQILSYIANASLLGNLGFFVGTGLSKALTDGEAPSFKELLTRVGHDLDLGFDFDDLSNLIGKSFPRIAQEMVARVASRYYVHEDREAALRKAAAKFKHSICRECNLVPEQDIANRYREILKDIPIQWVVTTNYDFLLEDILPSSIYLLPNHLMNIRNDFVPIYHLHGHLRVPESLVITESDYIKLFSPTEYRQLKLNLLLAESATVMLGYNLGDVNVQSAIEWSRTFKSERGLQIEKYQSIVIQALFQRGTPRGSPYYGSNGEVIIETSDLSLFLSEIRDTITIRREEYESSRRLFQEWLAAEKTASVIANDSNARSEFIETVKKFPRSYDIQMLIKFLSAVLEPIWTNARQDQGFEHYDHFLNILLDIIENIPVSDTHPSLFAYLAEKLNDVASFIEPDGTRSRGTSWSASVTWQRRKSSIPDGMKKELTNYAKLHHGYRLRDLLR